MAVVKGLELFTFELPSLWPFAGGDGGLLSNNPAAATICPNCGYRMYHTIVNRVNFSKAMVLICCGGAIIYWNLVKNGSDRLPSVTPWLSSAIQAFRNRLTNLLVLATPETEHENGDEPHRHRHFHSHHSRHTATNFQQQYCHHHSVVTSNNIVNQLVVNNVSPYRDNYQQQSQPHTSLASTNYSSLNLSSLGSIGAGTLAKLDDMLDEVQEIKDCMNDSCNELQLYRYDDAANDDVVDYYPMEEAEDSSILMISNEPRRISDGEVTTSLPSLEWDLNDVNLAAKAAAAAAATDGAASSTSNLILDYNNFIDPEALSEIIFNKDFEFKDERFFKMKKQFLSTKQRLKCLSRTTTGQQQRRLPPEVDQSQPAAAAAGADLNSYHYRSNRDSAFFEDL